MPDDFANFEIEDFAFDESFQRWVKEAESPYNSFWDTYLKENPGQTDKIIAARALVMDLMTESYSGHEKDMISAIWGNVNERIASKSLVSHFKFKIWHAAASVALVLVAFAAAFMLRTLPGETISYGLGDTMHDEIMQEVNRTDKAVKVHLSDGSVVSLAKDSRLTYPQKFGSGERIVRLNGEAFFDIQKDADHPFLIYANETVTKVLGTSFTIKAREGEAKVIVAVVTGKVSVFLKKDFEKDPQSPDPAGIVLTPNQQAEFSRDQEQFKKTLVPEPRILTGTERQSFDFDNLPLIEVFSILEKAYGVEIVYDDDLVVGRSLSVSLEDEPLPEKLKIICGTMGMSYQIVDAKIIIENKK